MDGLGRYSGHSEWRMRYEVRTKVAPRLVARAPSKDWRRPSWRRTSSRRSSTFQYVGIVDRPYCFQGFKFLFATLKHVPVSKFSLRTSNAAPRATGSSFHGIRVVSNDPSTYIDKKLIRFCFRVRDRTAGGVHQRGSARSGSDSRHREFSLF